MSIEFLDAAIAAKGGAAAVAGRAAQDARKTLVRRPLRAADVGELAQMPFHPRKAILTPWLHSQDLCMIFAARGIGKTHFALAIAYAVAAGGQFLRWHAPRPAKVLYLDGELPGTVMQRRLLAHCPDVEPAPGFLRVFTPDMPEMNERGLPDLSTVEGQAEIDGMIEDDTALVIVDNLSAWARSGRENEAESWHPVADWILGLRRRGIAVILVHHAGKSGSQRGTSKKEDLLDVVIGLSRPIDYDPQQGAAFVVEFSKARNLMGEDAESLEVALGGTDDRAAWTWRTAEASTFDRVVALTNEGLTPSEVATELSVNKSTVSRSLRKAREGGLITAKEASRGTS
jgi:DNA-binding transcriptional ArsR family regulator